MDVNHHVRVLGKPECLKVGEQLRFLQPRVCAEERLQATQTMRMWMASHEGCIALVLL